MDFYNILRAPDVRKMPDKSPETQLNEYYLNVLKPQMISAFKADPTLEWVSFTLLQSEDPPILHIGAVDSTSPNWVSFQTVIEPAVRGSPTKLVVRIIDEVLRELAGKAQSCPGIIQSCPTRPFILGNSIAVTDNLLPGTLGGFLTAMTSNGLVRFPFSRYSWFRMLTDPISDYTESPTTMSPTSHLLRINKVSLTSLTTA